MGRETGISMFSSMRRTLPIAFTIGLLLCWSASEAYCTSWRTPTAIESNLLAFDGKLAFLQGSGGLTVLDLETGQVLLRKMLEGNLRYAGEFIKCPGGVLLVGSRQSTLCDADTFEPVWTIENTHSVVVDGPHIISCDGYHTVFCHDSRTGKERWSEEIRGGWQLMIFRDIVIVVSVAYDGGIPAFWVIDADTGRERYHKSPPADRDWYRVHCDGEFVYAVTGKIPPNEYSALPQGLIRYDLDGRELEQLDLSSPEISRLDEWPHSPLVYGGKVFPKHRNCRLAYPHERKPVDLSILSEYADTHALPSGLFVHEQLKDINGDKSHVVRLLSEDYHWSAYLPYSQPNEWLEAVVQADNRVVFCSSGGQIECFDSKSGKSQWTYMFPSFRRVLAAADCYIGSFWQSKETSQADMFAKGLTSLGNKTGSIPIPDTQNPADIQWPVLMQDTEYAGRVSVDPNPKLRFRDLPERLTSTRAFLVALSIPFVLLLFWHARWLTNRSVQIAEGTGTAKKHYMLIAGCGIVVFTAAAIGLHLFGQVSSTSTSLYWGVALTSLALSWRAMNRATADCSSIVQFISIIPVALFAGVAIALAASPY